MESVEILSLLALINIQFVSNEIRTEIKMKFGVKRIKGEDNKKIK